MRASRLRLRSISYTILSLLLLLAAASSCSSSRRAAADYSALARAGLRLGFDIEEHDNWPLMLSAASWMGVPYKYAGNSRNGIDCSGLTSQVYEQLYGIKLHRNSLEQYTKDVKMLRTSQVRQGDLVFFAPKAKASDINHVGIFLKRNLFLHASTSRGVRVDRLDDSYWYPRFVGYGRVRGLD